MLLTPQNVFVRFQLIRQSDNNKVPRIYRKLQGATQNARNGEK